MMQEKALQSEKLAETRNVEQVLEQMRTKLDKTTQHDGLPPLKKMEEEALKARGDLEFETDPLKAQGIASAQQSQGQQYPTYRSKPQSSPPLPIGMAMVAIAVGAYFVLIVLPQQKERKHYSVIPNL
jgi:hypothetical protein